MDKVKVGIIGSGGWTNLAHLPSLKGHPQTELVAICSRNQERAAERAAKYGIRSIPTLLLFNGGELKDSLVGAVPNVKAAIDKLVGKVL